jgi:flagellum-specific peptidoglycan hydrolase FlgJ
MKFKNPFSSPLKDFLTEAEETALYEQAATEIENGIMNKGLWAKALSKADGNEEKQKAIYMELLVDYLKKEIAAGKELASILDKEKQAELKRNKTSSSKKKKSQNKKTYRPKGNPKNSIRYKAEQEKKQREKNEKEKALEEEKAARQKKYLEEEEAQKKDVEEFIKELKEKAEKISNRIKNQ